MKIEVGGFYRLRCGGAVKIDRIDDQRGYCYFDHNDRYYQSSWSYPSGYCVLGEDNNPFDLVSEITEAEYNRIVSGAITEIDRTRFLSSVIDDQNEQISELESQIDSLQASLVELAKTKGTEAPDAHTSAILDTAETAMGKMSDEIEELKKALEFMSKERDEWKDKYCNVYSNDLKERRERIATAVYAGLLSGADRHSQTGDCQSWNYEHLAKISVIGTDALIKALEVTK
jgi:predicted  nucleic acid-binding Zn-ribbon protein